MVFHPDAPTPFLFADDSFARPTSSHAADHGPSGPVVREVREAPAERKVPGGFYKLPAAVVADPRFAALGGTAAKVYLALARFADRDGGCWPSVATVARVAGLTVKSVRQHLRSLEEAGVLVVEPRTGTSSRYRLLARPDDHPCPRPRPDPRPLPRDDRGGGSSDDPQIRVLRPEFPNQSEGTLNDKPHPAGPGRGAGPRGRARGEAAFDESARSLEIERRRVAFAEERREFERIVRERHLALTALSRRPEGERAYLALLALRPLCPPLAASLAAKRPDDSRWWAALLLFRRDTTPPARVGRGADRLLRRAARAGTTPWPFVLFRAAERVQRAKAGDLARRRPAVINSYAHGPT